MLAVHIQYIYYKMFITKPCPKYFLKNGQLGPKAKLSRAQLAKNRNGRVHSSY